MKELNKNQLLEVTGGTISATLLNAIIRGADLFLEVGRSLGTAIKRFFSKKVCKI